MEGSLKGLADGRHSRNHRLSALDSDAWRDNGSGNQLVHKKERVMRILTDYHYRKGFLEGVRSALFLSLPFLVAILIAGTLIYGHYA